MKLRPAVFVIVLLLLVQPLTASGAINPRPLSGSGLLLVRQFPSGKEQQPLLLTLYREPEVGRLLELDTAEIPSLAMVFKTVIDQYPLMVTRSRGEWLRIAYDEAGREGWLRLERHWDYQPWDALLKGKPARLLTGLKKGYYQLFAAPASNSKRLETLSKQRQLRIIEVQGDWALVIVDLATSGWIRWRDDDGRFLISIEERLAGKQN